MLKLSNIIFTVVIFLLANSTNVCNGSEKEKNAATHLTPAFPGAMGGGMYTTGGRGGKVIKVTNLNDSGPGSLREAIETPGPRTILFDVSGTITLQSSIKVEHGNLTIAGQSAPGDGICIKGHEVRLEADNIIIRYIRFRPGDIAGQEYDALTGMRNRDIIIDHCSMSWSTDEVVSFYDNENFTLQWCLISESLNNSVHSKGAHGYGGIWGGKNASFLNNILAHHNSRNPRLQGTRYQQEENMEKVELINNIIFNWGNKAMYGGENGRYNMINNIFIPGPASGSSADEILEPYRPYGRFFINGNVIAMGDLFLDAGWDNISVPQKEIHNLKQEEPHAFNNFTDTQEALTAYLTNLRHAGASLRRDETDSRIIDEIKNRTYTFGKSGIIDSQEQTGGWPLLRSFPTLADSDGDGIPDDWEKHHGLNPLDPNDGNAFTLSDKYTNLEIYLNYLITNNQSIQKP